MDDVNFFNWIEWVGKEIDRIKKQMKCEHKDVIYDATGNTGICIKCGKTIRR